MAGMAWPASPVWCLLRLGNSSKTEVSMVTHRTCMFVLGYVLGPIRDLSSGFSPSLFQACSMLRWVVSGKSLQYSLLEDSK